MQNKVNKKGQNIYSTMTNELCLLYFDSSCSTWPDHLICTLDFYREKNTLYKSIFCHFPLLINSV